MKPLGQAVNDLERMAEDAIRAIEGWRGKDLRYETAAAAVVSPIHRAVESACFNVDVEDQAIFLKVRFPDMATCFDERATADACRTAATLGVAPRVLHSDAGRGVLATDRLGADWRWARVDDLADSRVLEAVVGAKKTLHEGPELLRNENVFDVIDRYWRAVVEARLVVPSDTPDVVKQTRLIRDAIASAGADSRPCHGDGVASNVMLGPSGGVQLVDFDMAANTDPYYDLGSLMVEAFQFADDARQILEIYDGTVIEALHNRCRLYGIADDLMWALWGFLSFARSPRKEVEFTKYAEWRLLRCRWQLGDPDFDRWMGRL